MGRAPPTTVATCPTARQEVTNSGMRPGWHAGHPRGTAVGRGAVHSRYPSTGRQAMLHTDNSRPPCRGARLLTSRRATTCQVQTIEVVLSVAPRPPSPRSLHAACMCAQGMPVHTQVAVPSQVHKPAHETPCTVVPAPPSNKALERAQNRTISISPRQHAVPHAAAPAAQHPRPCGFVPTRCMNPCTGRGAPAHASQGAHTAEQ